MIRISVSGEVSEIDYDFQMVETRTHSAYSLPWPEDWEHDRKFRLTITMLDRFEPRDDLNIQATLLFNRLRTSTSLAETIICGDVYIGNETDEDIIDFTMDDFNYILDHMW